MRYAFVVEQSVKLTALEHFFDDITAANKLTLNIELRNSGPVGINFDAFAQFFIFQNIVGGRVKSQVLHDLRNR